MNMKLWIIIAISTLLVENKTNEFSINFKTPNDSFSIKANSIKSTYWNVYVPDEADVQKLIPINYTISKQGIFKTILFNTVDMNEVAFFEGIDWKEVNKIKLKKEGESDILISRKRKDNIIILKQKRGDMLRDNETVTIKW